METAAERLMTRVLNGPAACVECLVAEVPQPKDRVRQAATDLVAAGVLVERPGHCEGCRGDAQILQVTGTG